MQKANNNEPELEEDIETFADFFEWEERSTDMPYKEHVLAGSMAGVIEHCSLLPIDIIKTHQQSALYKTNIHETVSFIYQTGGGAKFWRGTGPMVAGCIPAHAIFFSIYEISRSHLKLNESSDLNIMMNGMVGCLSTAFHD